MTALGGYDVIVQDINEEATDLARFEMIDGRWGMKASVQKGKITYQACEDAIPRLTTTLDQADLADCDLIIEAVPCAPLSSRIHPSLGCCRWSPPQSMAADDVLPAQGEAGAEAGRVRGAGQDLQALLHLHLQHLRLRHRGGRRQVLRPPHALSLQAACTAGPSPSASRFSGFGRRLQTTDKQL